jgi:NADP-reducing hydrogenase subunit HndB
MPRVTIEDLKKIREQAVRTMTVRGGEARARIIMHMGTCGIAAGAREVMAALLKEVEDLKLSDVIVTTSSCAGLCSREPMATVQLAGQTPVKYVDLTPEKIVQVLKQHVLEGKIAAEFALASGSETTG